MQTGCTSDFTFRETIIKIFFVTQTYRSYVRIHFQGNCNERDNYILDNPNSDQILSAVLNDLWHSPETKQKKKIISLYR